MTTRLQAVLLNAVVVVACLIQLARGYRPLVILICGLTFLLAGNATLYIAGSKARTLRRQQKRDYYAN